MPIIYETRGKAREYFELAANLYRGCSHSCSYCFGPDVLHMSKEQFYNDPSVRDSVVYKLDRDAAELAKHKDQRPILLSFVCDPYQPLDLKLQTTRKAIEVLKGHGLAVAILTKGGLRAIRDFDLLEPGRDQFGVTLTVLDEKKRQEWEPGAMPAAERIESLRQAKALGLKTFLSLEPILGLEEAIKVIEATYPVVDRFLVGRLNYHPASKDMLWKAIVQTVIVELDSRECSYYIKRSLSQYVGYPDGIARMSNK